MSGDRAIEVGDQTIVGFEVNSLHRLSVKQF